MQPSILLWINRIDTAGEDRHGAGLEGGVVGGGVDAERQAGDDDVS